MWTAIELSTNRRPGNNLRSQISIERLEDRVTPSASGWGDFQDNLVDLYTSAYVGDEVGTIEAFNELYSDYVDFFEYTTELKDALAGQPFADIYNNALDLINYEIYSDIIEAGTGALSLITAYQTLDPVLASQGVNLLYSGFVSGYVNYGLQGLGNFWAAESQNYSGSDDFGYDDFSDETYAESVSNSVDDFSDDLFDDTSDQFDDSSDD
jgi:hypothetical protein